MKEAQDAALAAQFTERPPRNMTILQRNCLAHDGLREAYQLVRRGGLIRADHIDLKVNTKNPDVPLLMWTFTGTYQTDGRTGRPC